MQPSIVYVDDDPDDRYLLADAYQEVETSIPLVTMGKVSELYALLETNAADISLLILDINLPMMNGIDVLKDLRSKPEYQSIPVVLFSTSKRDTKLIEGLAAEIVQKPNSCSELKTLIGDFLNRANSQESFSLK